LESQRISKLTGIWQLIPVNTAKGLLYYAGLAIPFARGKEHAVSPKENVKRKACSSGPTAKPEPAKSIAVRKKIAQESRNLLNEPIPERLQKLVDEIRKAKRTKARGDSRSEN
jgi:hypothetical protein